MAIMASAAREIPQGLLTRDNLTVVAGHGEPTTVARAHPTLPTPPNSISPALPAHGLKAQLQKAKLEPIDSDLDLQDGASGRSVSPAGEASGAITTTLLAKYHLPEILLNHGPLAIRHISGYLTTSVPGFSGIPPTKARRLVVGALEGRGGEGGGLEGDVEFEKVGWGRWDARRRGQGPRGRQATPPHDPSDGPTSIPISQANWRDVQARRAKLGTSCGGESMHFSHDEDIMMPEHDADNMSMDGSGTASCSEAPDDDDMIMDDPEDATDDEDWAAIGAAALRAESCPHGPHPGMSGFSNIGGARSFSATTAMARVPQHNFDFSKLASTSDAQERDAVEALLRLGSV